MISEIIMEFQWHNRKVHVTVFDTANCVSATVGATKFRQWQPGESYTIFQHFFSGTFDISASFFTLIYWWG